VAGDMVDYLLTNNLLHGR